MMKRKNRKAVSELVGAVLLILITLVAMVYLVEVYLSQTSFASQGLSQQAHDAVVQQGQAISTAYYSVEHNSSDNSYTSRFYVVDIGSIPIKMSSDGVLLPSSGGFIQPKYTVYALNTTSPLFLGNQNDLVTLYPQQTYVINVIYGSQVQEFYINSSGINYLEVTS